MNQAETMLRVRAGWTVYFRLPITTTEPLNDWLADNCTGDYDVRYGAVLFSNETDAMTALLRWR